MLRFPIGLQLPPAFQRDIDMGSADLKERPLKMIFQKTKGDKREEIQACISSLSRRDIDGFGGLCASERTVRLESGKDDSCRG